MRLSRSRSQTFQPDEFTARAITGMPLPAGLHLPVARRRDLIRTPSRRSRWSAN
jgi:hypothetical protein